MIKPLIDIGFLYWIRRSVFDCLISSQASVRLTYMQYVVLFRRTGNSCVFCELIAWILVLLYENGILLFDTTGK